MNLILLVALIGLVIGFFLFFGISPMEFTEGIFNRLLAKPNSIKSQINEATKRKKPNIFRREISEAQEILRLTKGSISVKLGKLQSAITTGLEQLRKPSQTAAELKKTARKLYDIADHALRLSTEETLAQRAEQKETSVESPSNESQFTQVMSF